MTNIRHYRLLLSLALFLPAALVSADDEHQGYLFASYGETDVEFSVTPNDTIQGDDRSFELGFGFALGKHLALEGSYQNFGDPDGFAGCPPDMACIAIVPFSREPVEIDGWAVALRGNLPLTDNLSGFIRLGLLAWDTSARTAVLNDSDTDLLFGIGLAADLGDRFGLQASFEQVELDIETVKVGVTYRF